MPEMLEAYENILPGLAERIVRMSEISLDLAVDQGEHRQRLEWAVTNANIRARYVSLVCGLIIVLALVGAAIAMVFHGQSAFALAALFATIGPIIGTYYRVMGIQREELARKRALVDQGRNIPARKTQNK